MKEHAMTSCRYPSSQSFWSGEGMKKRKTKESGGKKEAEAEISWLWAWSERNYLGLKSSTPCPPPRLKMPK